MMRSVPGALAVCVAYYLGAYIGFVLKLVPNAPSIMWPPNAILTAALLLVPPGRWWIYILAVLPAHLAVELGVVLPTSLAVALYFTNCSEALIAAAVIWRLSDAPSRLDTLRRVGVFVLGAGVLGPFLSTFLDAAAVSVLRDAPYWQVWRMRYYSNTLSQLTLTPALLVILTGAPEWLARASVRRRAEAALLTVALVVVGTAAFNWSHDDANAIPGIPRQPLAFILPLLLWAAVRFGPGGLSLAMFLTVVVAVTAVARGHGPFEDFPARAGIPALQILLSAAAPPLMCLAALIEERRRAQAALGERLRYEELLSQLSGAFVHLPSHEMDSAFGTWLKRVGEALQLDRVLLVRAAADGRGASVAHWWTADGAPPVPHEAGMAHLSHDASWPWLLRGEPVLLRQADGAPAAPLSDLEAPGPGLDLVIPLVAGDRVLGGLIFDAAAVRSQGRKALVPELRLVAEVFAGALARKESEDAVRASEIMKSAILASLSTGVAVLDRDGRIIAVNESWTRLAQQDGWARGAYVGSNYLDACRAAALNGVSHAAEALVGIRGVLEQARPAFTLDYASGAAPHDRWFAMAVVPLNRAEGGAVVSHTDVTERKRAEMEAERNRQELAHFTRVSTMGELTASLAHELSQPLSGILTNAQAAQRFLDTDTPDVGEVRAILSDIVDDDKRAGEVIQRLRDLLRKSELSRVLLDLNGLIRDVIRLLASDAVIRNVTFTLELSPESMPVVGDRVQLQQVVLNLLVNAMEAVAESSDGDRIIAVRTEKANPEHVQVSVRDSGPGLGEGGERRAFEPFYTTKPGGMGMGLSIARSIVLAHGGLIWATNGPARGATFHLSLPLGLEAEA
jgi:signal transduction histidine kinase/integral membrane sensor domain MASE1